MLSCKRCGAQMSGVDLICKRCGTPWGKTRKSNKKIYFYVFFVLLLVLGFYGYLNRETLSSFLYKINSAKIPEEVTPNPPPVENVPVENTEIPIENPPKEPTITVPPVIEDIPPSPNTPPAFSWISSSSSLGSQGKFSYSAELTVDGDFKTAWLEGVEGNGIGEWLMYSSEQEQLLSSINIFNGYLKNNITYTNNGRLKKVSLELSDGTIITKEMPKSSFAESKEGFKISLGEPVKTTFVKLTILDVYPGAYYKDTGISGISFE